MMYVLNLMGVSVGQVVVMLALTLAAVFLEGLGINFLMPVLSFAETGALDAENANAHTRVIVEGFESLGIRPTFALLVGVCFALLASKEIANITKRILIERINHLGRVSLRKRAMASTLVADLEFFNKSDHGRFVHTIHMESGLAAVLVSTVTNIIFFGGLLAAYIAIMFVISWELTLLAVPVGAVFSILLNRFVRKTRAASGEIKDRSGRMVQFIDQIIRGIRVIKQRSFETEVLDDAKQEFLGLSLAQMHLKTLRSLSEGLYPLLIITAIFFTLYIAVTELSLSVAELGLFLLVTLRVQQAATNLNSERLIYAQSIVSLHHVEEFIAEAEFLTTPVTGELPFSFNHELRFDNVSFHYEKEARAALNGLSLDIKKGSKVAIVGHSGSGKTTAANLILRFFTPTDGTIFVDKTPIADVRMDELRRSIALVGQDTYLFRDTVRSNLCFGMLSEPDEAAIWRALDQAHATDFISELPEKLETILGEDGVNFSGGQRQRLAIARALLQKAPILILDEPTSALDSETEQTITSALAELPDDTTIITITHRLSTVLNADDIFLLDEGVLVGHGKHEELMAKSERYRRLFQVSSRDDELATLERLG